MKYMVIAAMLLWGCSSNDTVPAEGGPGGEQVDTGKQINLTILLDLSDRIDPKQSPDNPAHFEKDSTLISYFTQYFLQDMETKGSYRARGKFRVVFCPNPPNRDIGLAAAELNIDLSKTDIKAKKAIHETMQHVVSWNVGRIYRSAINQQQWPGADIWRFFKNDVKDIAVDKDPNYRNILVVFTDGYIYHSDSKDKMGNRYAYILPDLLAKCKLRCASWSEKIDKMDFGLISKRSDLSQLEVLMLEISPSPKYRNDEDIIRKVLDKWFTEMKVKKWKVLNSDLPEFTKHKINDFLRIEH